MVSFVFIPLVADLMQQSQGTAANPDDTVVVSSDYGTVTESRLQQMQANRSKLNGVLAELIQRAQGFTFQLPAIFGPATEKEVVETFLLARRAEKMGVVVSNKAITDFIKQVSGERASDADLAEILNLVRWSQRDFAAALREELLAGQLRSLVLADFAAGTPPAQRWQYYQRLYRRANAEVVPVLVSDFVSRVPEPDEANLVAFFNEHKDRYYESGSPTPGFHQPDKAAFEYLKAEYNAFLRPETISAEEVAKHYEKFKDTRYLYTELPGGEEPAGAPVETPAAGDDTTSEAAPETTPADSATSDENTSADSAPAADEGAVDSDAAASAAEESPAATDASPAAPEASADPAAPNDAPAESAPPGGGGDDAAGSEAPVTEPPTTEAAATDDSSAATTETATAESTEAQPAATDSASQPIADDLVLPTDIAVGGTNPKYDPLWKVESRIRDELAREQATRLIQETLKKLQRKMQAYARAHDEALTKDPQAPPPERPKLDSWAAESGLSAHSTGLVSALELGEQSELGQATVSGSDSFAEIGYRSLPVLGSLIAQDLAGNQYLVWKVEEKKDYVPTLNEIRAEVVQTWKMIQARNLARERAEELAATARKSEDKTLSELLAGQDVQVLSTGPFTWLTTGAAPTLGGSPPPRLTEVPGVVDAGPRFMETVFGLSPGKTSVAFNNPETAAYVVRVTAVEPSEAVAQAEFMSYDYRRYAQAAGPDFERFRNHWTSRLEAEANLVWRRPADAPTRQ